MKGIYFWTSFLFVFSSITLCYSQEINSLPDSIADNFTRQLKVFPQENLYVQTDKPYYIGGEDIWFRVFLTDYISHIPDTTSRYVYTELISPTGKELNRIKTIPRDGAYYGHIHLDELLPEGSYQLRSYTRYMDGLGDEYLYRKQIYIGDPLSASYRTHAEFHYEEKNEKVQVRLSFASIQTGEKIWPKEIRYINAKGETKVLKTATDSIVRLNCDPDKDLERRILHIEYDYNGRFHKQQIPVPYPESRYDVSFFPEGGHFPAGTRVRIGFKALKPNGLATVVEGRIVDATGQEVTTFRSNDLGMGSFYLIAKPGERYTAVCKNKKGNENHFELPVPEEGVLSLQASWTKNILNASVSTTSDTPIPSNLYVLIQCRGVLLYCKAWNAEQKYLQLKNSNLPSGVLQFILVDENKTPLSERLVFNMNTTDIARVEIEPSDTIVNPRTLVRTSVRLTGEGDEILEGDFAVSVTDDSKVSPDSTNTILTTLLLTSEFSGLRGYIENPGWYFSKYNEKGIQELDHLLLTQGWSRYDVHKILEGNISLPKGLLELGPEISGTVSSGLGYMNKKAGYQVALTSLIPAFYETIETDDQGRFRFMRAEFPDSTRFIAQALTEKGGKGLELILDTIGYPKVDYCLPVEHINVRSEIEAYARAADEQYKNEHGERMIYLDDVVITARKKGKSPLSVADSKKVTSQTLNEMNASSLYLLLRSIPELRVTQDRIEWTNRSINKSAQKADPFIVIDEIIFDEMDFIIGMSAENVEEIELAKPYSNGAAMLSRVNPRAYEYGVILITTKNRDGGFPERKGFNKKSIMPLGYQTKKEFYSPRYETQASNDSISSDLRTTLYWNPNVSTNEGQASFEFYSADRLGCYTITIEGLTKEGRLIRKNRKVWNKKQ